MSFLTRHFGVNKNPKPFKLPVYTACMLTMLGITSQALSDAHAVRNGIIVEAQQVQLFKKCDNGDWGCEISEAHYAKGGKK